MYFLTYKNMWIKSSYQNTLWVYHPTPFLSSNFGISLDTEAVGDCSSQAGVLKLVWWVRDRGKWPATHAMPKQKMEKLSKGKGKLLAIRKPGLHGSGEPFVPVVKRLQPEWWNVAFAVQPSQILKERMILRNQIRNRNNNRGTTLWIRAGCNGKR